MKRLHITRRQMIAGAARTAEGLALTCSCAPLAEQEQAKAADGFKLGVCDWTVGKTADPGSFEIAKRIGLDGVHVDFGRGDNRLPLFDEELQQNILDEARKQKMEIAYKGKPHRHVLKPNSVYDYSEPTSQFKEGTSREFYQVYET